jgi:hypothetical protein
MELCRTYGALECDGALSMIGLHPIISYITPSGVSWFLLLLLRQ